MKAQTACGLLICVAILAAPAFSQVGPDYGFSWSTITNAGNRNTTIEEAPRLGPPWVDPFLPIGAVDHEYRIATTEVSTAQWFEFVQAYSPYYSGNPNDLHFTGPWISLSGDQYVMNAGAADRPAAMSWRYAARYVNWLNNDKRPDRDAFESGAYDTATFSTNPDGTYNDQREHSPDARFWIPTLNELTKAAYYDPNRYGDGVEGYWLYPNGTNTPLVPGYPEEGGQTSAGLSPGAPNAHWLDIGSYPDVLTPWGLLDASGGVAEWTESIGEGVTARVVRGTAQYDPGSEILDRLDYLGFQAPHAGLAIGLRVASAVPGSGTLPALVLLSVLHLKGRRRCQTDWDSASRSSSCSP